MNLRSRAVALAFVTLTASPIYADSNPEVPGVADQVESRTLHDTRAIQVVMPDGFSRSSNSRYDVLYVLDAEDDAKRILEIVRALQDGQGFIPPLIVVNVWTMSRWDRNKDLTPTHSKDFPSSGGADAFLAFFRNELIPYVNGKYPTSGHSVLYGHSLGGLFGLHALLEEPQLFDAYVLTDPSLWWDGGRIVNDARQSFAGRSYAGRTLWIGSRDGADHAQMGIDKMDAVLRSFAPRNLHWRSESYADETHTSVLHKSAYDGLKYAYAGFPGNEAIGFIPTAGIVAKQMDFPFLLGSRLPHDPVMRFTTDGTAPTSYSRPLLVTNSMRADTHIARVTAKSFGFAKWLDQTIVANYTPGKIWPATVTDAKVRAGGIHYAYYEGAWEKLPDFRSLAPVNAGLADENFTLETLPRKQDFGLVLDGFIKVPVTAHYILLLSSDDGSRLSIDGHVVAENDGIHAADSPKDFMLPLERGLHAIRIEYFQRDGGEQLSIMLVNPGSTDLVTVPWSALYHEP